MTAPPQLASRIVVYKTQHQMLLINDMGQIMRSYPIAMGGNPVGPKECEGDMKTPEGQYFIEGHNPDSRYHLSLKISYPNDQDIARAKELGISPGGDIFIHGQPNDAGLWRRLTYYDSKTDWTHGCIAVSDAAMDDIWRHVADGTPIEILP